MGWSHVITERAGSGQMPAPSPAAQAVAAEGPKRTCQPLILGIDQAATTSARAHATRLQEAGEPPLTTSFCS